MAKCNFTLLNSNLLLVFSNIPALLKGLPPYQPLPSYNTEPTSEPPLFIDDDPTARNKTASYGFSEPVPINEQYYSRKKNRRQCVVQQ